MHPVLITRAEHAANRTAVTLTDMGFFPIVFPLFEVLGTRFELPESRFDGFAFTSENAIQILMNRGWHVGEISTPAFCVGERTASAAERLGFHNILTAKGSAEQLAEMISNYFNGNSARIAYPCGVRLQFDLPQSVRKSGIDMESYPIYEHRRKSVGAQAFAKLMVTMRGGSALIYSTASGQYFSELVSHNELEPHVEHINCVCISDRAADSVKFLPWARLVVAETSSEESMTSCLVETSGF